MPKLTTFVLVAGVATAYADSIEPGSAKIPSKANRPSFTFEMDVQPLLTKFGCNSGACHGKSGGQNGFALSLLGFDADFDHDALIAAIHEYHGRERRYGGAGC